MKRDFERAPQPTATRYFTREELERAWRAIRPLDDARSLDEAMDAPCLPMVIKCAALAARRAAQAINQYGALHPPRDAEIAQHVLAKRLRCASRRVTRPDAKQRAANDLDLFDPVEAT